MQVGNKIVALRKKYNYTQEKLAEKVGVSRQTLSNWESNITSPDLNQAIILSRVLKISLDELVDNELEIECKNNNQLFTNLINKTCYLSFVDDYFNLFINYSTLVKVLSVSTDFIKVEYLKNKKKAIKLIDIDLVIAIKVIEEEL